MVRLLDNRTSLDSAVLWEGKMHMSLKRIRSKKLPLLLALSLLIALLGIATAHARGDANKQEQFPRAPERIIVLPLSAEEILLEMIGPERIVGAWHEYLEGAEVFTPTMGLTKGMQHEIDIDDTKESSI